MNHIQSFSCDLDKITNFQQNHIIGDILKEKWNKRNDESRYNRLKRIVSRDALLRPGVGICPQKIPSSVQDSGPCNPLKSSGVR